MRKNPFNSGSLHPLSKKGKGKDVCSWMRNFTPNTFHRISDHNKQESSSPLQNDVKHDHYSYCRKRRLCER